MSNVDAATTTAEWRQALAAFEAWVSGSDTDRAEQIERLRRDEPQLHRRLLALIRADAEAHAQQFLAADVLVDLEREEARQSSDAIDLGGQRLGPWKLERPIGSGGMGQVWLARRDDGLYEGHVAIKMLRVAVADSGANQRFAREGQFLARLTHPHIARLLDAGFTPAGQRYLVLEYVVGERLDRWCDARKLSIDARIGLFLQVCAAVSHAHANLVVHRDLKPSNILVQDDGQAKLLDFGVAKLLDATQDDAATQLTALAGAALTPEYAAPEQLSGAPITIATDVYSLGVILYGLLCGRPPYGSDGESPLQRARHVVDTEPVRLADRIDREDEAVAAIAERRSTSSERLRRTLSGDLETIVGKALKKDPAQRYASVDAMAQDLNRYLAREPISARPDTLGYRARMFVARNRLAVTLVSVALIGVIGGAGVAAWQAYEARQKAAIAVAEAAKAEAVKQFLVDLFEQANGAVRAEGVQAREATINDMLAAGAKQIDHSFAAQPAIRDEIYRMLVELYTDTGDPKETLALARNRVAAAHDGFGAEDARVAPAEVMLATALLNYGENQEAAKLLEHVEVVLDRAGERTSLEWARMLFAQGLLARAINARPPWPTHPQRRAAELLRERYPDQEEILQVLRELASAACSYGKPDEARAAAEEMLRRTLAQKGDDNLFVDEASWLLGGLLLKGGRSDEAIPLLERSVDGFIRHVGEKSPNVVVARFGLAEAYLTSGRADDSRRTFEAARQSILRDHARDKRLDRLAAGAEKDLADIGQGKHLRCGT